MRCYYDFHIHSALSPCGSEDMTPCNIVQMAMLKELAVIAVADHNDIGNVDSVMRASKRLNGPLVLPAMELETQEEVHMLLLFETLQGAAECHLEVTRSLPGIKNRSDIYGRQLLLNEFDEVTGERERLLTIASGIGVDEAVHMAAACGGIAIPAHIFRPSHGILSILGDIHPDMGFTTLETTYPNEREHIYTKAGYRLLYDSDAHDLELINERGGSNVLEVAQLTAKDFITLLKTPMGQ